MPWSVGHRPGRKAEYLSLVSPLDQNPATKCKQFQHSRRHHDRLYVIDPESAHDSLDFYQKANGSVLRYEHNSRRVRIRNVSLRNETDRFVGLRSDDVSATNEEEE